jgi:hypothetical protein
MKTDQKDKSVDNAPISGCMSTSKIMFELWERNANNLTKEQLEWFANATEYASTLTQDMQEVLNGLGCLIGANHLPHKKVGSFQSSDDIPTLLFFISRSLGNIQGLIDIGDAANDRLVHPERYKF